MPTKKRFLFPVPLLSEDSLDFSFSGLKSAVKREIDTRKKTSRTLSEVQIQEICYEFEQSVVEVLVTKLFRAAKQEKVATIMLAGGVSANDFLKAEITHRASQE